MLLLGDRFDYKCPLLASLLSSALRLDLNTIWTEPIFMCMTLQSGKKAIRGDRKGPDGRDHGRKSISEDLVSVINDGLFFYEQVKI